MSRLKELLVFDPDEVKIVRSRLADLVGANLTLGRYILLTKAGWEWYLRTDRKPNGLIYHEYRHHIQQRETGLLKFLFLYLLCLPFWWNPWRQKWELEAYRVSLAWRLETYGRVSDGYREHLISKLSSWRYGWMMRRKYARLWVEGTITELEAIRAVGEDDADA